MWTNYQEEQSKTQSWLLWLIIRINIFFFAFIFTLTVFTLELWFLVPFFFVGEGVLLFWILKDIKKDPYGVILVIKLQYKMLWRLNGKLHGKPFYYHMRIGFDEKYDFHTSVKLDKKLLLSGGTVKVKLKIPDLCPKCEGKRTGELTALVECTKCKNGFEPTKIGMFQHLPIPCGHCISTGWVPATKCSKCKGSGFIWANKNVKIKIPPDSINRIINLPALGKFDIISQDRGDCQVKLKSKWFG